VIVDYAPPLGRLRGRFGPRLRRSLAIGTVSASIAVIGLGSAVQGGVRGSDTVVVRDGDTLWSIAAASYPGEDVRSRVLEIMVENHLASAAVHAGETLTMPGH